MWSRNYLSFWSTWVHLRVTWSLVLCVCFVDRCLSFCHFSFGYCVVCPSIYGFWLLLWYLRFTDSDYSFGIFKLFLHAQSPTQRTVVLANVLSFDILYDHLLNTQTVNVQWLLFAEVFSIPIFVKFDLKGNNNEVKWTV